MKEEIKAKLESTQEEVKAIREMIECNEAEMMAMLEACLKKSGASESP
jgi:hypothetical protein